MNSYNEFLNEYKEIGIVWKVNGIIAYVAGLPGVKIGEVIIFEDNTLGEILSFDSQTIEVMVFSKEPVKTKLKATRTDRFLTIPVNESMLGGSFDPLGRPLDPEQYVEGPFSYVGLRNEAWGIERRKRIERPFETGVSLVDLAVPIGKGQRQLIIGDRKTGKTSFLLQTILLQAKKGTVCIYAAIGKKKAEIKRIEEYFKQNNLEKNTIIIASSSDDPSSLIFLTPYAAMAIAEYFRDLGRDVFLILDDLITHAKFYREISLLAGRFPGRNSYPADIFFVHSQLLERAGSFSTSSGDASITAFVVAETQQGDLSGYIQTNIMSMTDGHIFFDIDIFMSGRRPAINVFLSVTRVGKQVQPKLRRDINRELNSFFSYAQRLKNFSHFGEEATVSVKSVLAVESRLNEFFTQQMSMIIPVNFQVFIFALIWQNKWTNVTNEIMKKDIMDLITKYENDSQFRQNVDIVVNESSALNELLGKIFKSGLLS